METRDDEYKTLLSESSGIYKSKGSKFLSFAYPVGNEDAAKEIVGNLKKEYHDARHHCYAFLLGENKENYRINDDGEPSGTAGRPIFGQIQSKDITNVLIVVVRYFGGTLLGTGGLITAYKSAARDALENGTIINKTIDQTASVEFEYEDMNVVMRILSDDSVRILEQDFAVRCNIRFSVRKSRIISITEKLNLLKTASCQRIETEKKY